MEKTEFDEPFIEKKKHRGLKLFIVILLIAGLAFGGYYYYTNYYNNPTKKVDAILTDIEEKLLANYDQSLMEKAVKLNGLISLNIDAGKQANEILDLINKLSIQVNGEMDIKNKINNIDFSTKYDNGKLIDLKLYSENGDTYLYSKDLYDKYLYLGNTNEITGNTKNNLEITDLRVIIKSLTAALHKSLNTDNVVKTQETITIDNNQKDTNKYSIVLKDKEINNYLIKVLKELKNDNEFVNVIKKISSRVDFDSTINVLEEHDIEGTYTIDFYTAKDLVNEELISVRQTIKIDGEDQGINIDVLGNDTYLITVKEDGDTIECKITVNNKIFNIDLNTVIEDIKIALKVNFNFDEISSITKENTSNKINVEQMTQEDLQKIQENLLKNENLVKFLQKIDTLADSMENFIYGSSNDSNY